MVSYHSRAAPGEDVASTHKIRAKEKIDKYFFITIILPPTTRNVEGKYLATACSLLYRWTFNAAIRTVHTAITLFGF
ncbi:MAG: hypothetical protein HOF83_03370 [Pelagibacteraceae bacterium]|nr:hypothetical protein [Pelagibacteraceae bacterium]